MITGLLIFLGFCAYVAFAIIVGKLLHGIPERVADRVLGPTGDELRARQELYPGSHHRVGGTRGQ